MPAAAPAGSPSPLPPATGAAPAQERLSVGRGRRVLVVDDSPTVRALMADMLGRLGYRPDDIAFAADTAGARAAFDARAPRVVFLDLELDAADSGAGLAMEFLEKLPETRIILMTGYPEEDPQVRRVVRLGAFAYLGKPLRYQALKQVLHELESEEMRQERIR